MNLLVVAATELEIASLRDLPVDILVTGVGMVATAAWTARRLGEQRYDAAINVGVCGSFDPTLPPGAVVQVVADRIAELGAEDGDGFLRFDELQLPGECALRNDAPLRDATLDALPKVRAITVNTATGSERSVATLRERWHPQVESMEGAGFMYACRISGIQHAQIRAVSNVVERRNRAAWKMAEAMASLSTVCRAIVTSLAGREAGR